MPALFWELSVVNDPPPPEIDGEIDDTPEPPTTATCTTIRSPVSTVDGTVTVIPLVPDPVALDRVASGSITYGTGSRVSSRRNTRNCRPPSVTIRHAAPVGVTSRPSTLKTFTGGISTGANSWVRG